VSWLIISFNEELSFRGYILQRLAQAWGLPAAVVVSSLIFAMVHVLNPNVQPLAMVNLFAAGLLFSCAYLVSRSLWLPIGLHIGWNLAEIHLLGFPGSGVTEPARRVSSNPAQKQSSVGEEAAACGGFLLRKRLLPFPVILPADQFALHRLWSATRRAVMNRD
jgi:membrane protease YdiL (CAAX protease family)